MEQMALKLESTNYYQPLVNIIYFEMEGKINAEVKAANLAKRRWESIKNRTYKPPQLKTQSTIQFPVIQRPNGQKLTQG
jgi:hypothetical protein